MSDEKRISTPVRVIEIASLSECTSFPKFLDGEEGLAKKITIDVNDIDIENSLVVYVAHHWLRGSSSSAAAPDIGEFKAHPDDVDDHHFQLTIKGVTTAVQTFAPAMKNCYIWIDYCCLSDSEAETFRSEGTIADIMKYCDCLFIPIFDADVGSWSYPAKVNSWYEEYGAKAWNGGGRDSFMSRAWCRLELFFGATTPLLTAGVRKPGAERYAKFSSSLKVHAINEHRPNLLYGTHEHAKGILPIVMPPLQVIYLESYDPREGSLSAPEDRGVIERLVEELHQTVRRPKAGYVGERDESGKLHGSGVYTYANGDVYNGEFQSDRMCGHGTYTSVDGTVYVGDFKNDTMNGHGRYVSASGSVYEGEYVNGKRSGTGMYTFASGAVYTGMFLDDQMHGRGTYKSVEGSTYEGGYLFDQMHGQGTYKSMDGSVYVGEYREGRKHGPGVLTMANGKVFRGSYVDGKKHGPGMIEAPGAKTKHVTYIDGKRVTSGGAIYANESCRSIL